MGLEEIVKKLSSGGGSASERRVIQKGPSWSYELPSSFPSIENLYPMTDPCMYAMIMVCHLPSRNTPVMWSHQSTIRLDPSWVLAFTIAIPTHRINQYLPHKNGPVL